MEFKSEMLGRFTIDRTSELGCSSSSEEEDDPAGRDE